MRDRHVVVRLERESARGACRRACEARLRPLQQQRPLSAGGIAALRRLTVTPSAARRCHDRRSHLRGGDHATSAGVASLRRTLASRCSAALRSSAPRGGAQLGSQVLSALLTVCMNSESSVLAVERGRRASGNAIGSENCRRAHCSPAVLACATRSLPLPGVTDPSTPVTATSNEMLLTRAPSLPRDFASTAGLTAT